MRAKPEVARRGGAETVERVTAFVDLGAAGLALVRAAAAVLHGRGETKRIDPAWVDTYVRADRSKRAEEER